MDPSTRRRPPEPRNAKAAEASDHDRLAQYVERFYRRHERAKWPTVRRTARSLGWTQSRVEDASEGDPESRTFLTSYFTSDDPPLGEHFVETI